MQGTRIPDFTQNTFDGMLNWFAELSIRELLFHPDDSPSQIVKIVDGAPAFTAEECRKLEDILANMFRKHGDLVHEACYPVFMKAAGQRLDA
jgi:hypothetical protein